MKETGVSPLEFSEIRDLFGRTALHYAALEGHRDVIKILLEIGARCDVVDNEGLVEEYFK